MKNKTIKYISFFDFQDSKIQRNYVTAATNKIESICKSLNEIGYDVEIISMSSVTEDKFHFYKGHKVRRKEGLSLKLFPSWGGNNRILRWLRSIWHLFAMFVYLCLNVKRDEPIIVYHSQGYYNIILLAKRIRKFKMILEVEEIYSDVSNPKFNFMSKFESKMIEAADAFIFPTELLNDKLNSNHRPYAVIYGTYKVEPKIVDKFKDGKIHVVYAGTFDTRKGGAAAAAAAAFLPKNYHLHICGFGNSADTDLIKKTITDTDKISKAKVSFEGLKKGRDYIEFIQRCHIGLSTQDPSAAFNATSFPSKILSYMANGISVVSIDIPAIRTAKISPYLNFYKEQTPENIAKAIKHTTIDNNNRLVIAKLEKEFESKVVDLLTTVSPNTF